MTIHLKPEIEALIAEDVKRGAYGSADEFVEEAVRQLHAQENWMVASRDEIERSIDEGLAAAARGDVLTPEAVETRMDKMKREWLLKGG